MEPHYLKSKWNLDGVRADLANLVQIARSSGDYDIQLRNDYFSIYYQGKTLAEVRWNNSKGTYTAKIHWKFLLKTPPVPRWKKVKESAYRVYVAKDYGGDFEAQLPKGIRDYPCKLDSSGYAWFTDIHPKGRNGGEREIQQFFQKRHLLKLASNIRRKGGGRGEERLLEQVLITDNSPSVNFIIIDRQANVGGKKTDMSIDPQVDVMDEEESETQKIDILALHRRDQKDKYHFVVIEVKLGNNQDLVLPENGKAKVVEQLKDYVGKVKGEISEYADCYEKTYRQKVRLGLLKAPEGTTLEDEVKINRNPDTVDGLVVVLGYSILAKNRVNKLSKDCHLNIRRIENKPELADMC